jgi:hypothetical protein
MSNERPWFEDKLDQDEATLEEKGVPRQYWLYIWTNGVPGTKNHNAVGSVCHERKRLVPEGIEVPETAGVTVIDNRDEETYRKWMASPTIEEWEAQGPYTFEKLLDWVVKKEDYDFCALLDRIAHKFPVLELDRIVGPRGLCPPEKYTRYCEATDGWNAVPTNGKFSDDQLALLAQHNQIVAPIDISVTLVDMDTTKRLKMFKLIRDHHRDQSPKRK